MIITKIQLKNITTHKDTIIDFQEGLNVLTGNNGTGKSSVLSMIGFNLFDHLPGSPKSNYIRSAIPSPKSGEIKVWINGKNNQEYLIHRKIGKKKLTFTITDVNTGLEILETASGKGQFHEWLREQNDLNSSFDLETLFRTCIGVEQGMFTAPFLMTPSQRKKYFSEILNTDVYDRVYKNSIGIKRELESELQDITDEVNKLNIRLEQKTEKEIRLKKLKKEHDEYIKSKITADAKYNRQNEKYENLKVHKKKLDDAEANLKESELKIENTVELIKKNRIELEISKKAKNICIKTETDYNKFKTLRKEVENLEKKQEKVQKAKDKHSAIDGNIKEIDGKIQSFNTQIDKINRYKKLLPNLKNKFEEYNDLEIVITEHMKNVNEFEEYKKDKIRFKQEIEDFTLEIKNLKIKLKNINGIRELVSGLDKLNKEIEDYVKIESEFEGELHQLKQNKEQAKGGMCPFLHEKCKNIGEDSLEDYFVDKIEKLEKIIRAKKKTIQELREKKDNLISKEQQLKALEKSEVVLIETEKQLKKVKIELADIEIKIKKLEGSQKKLNELKDMKKNLEGEVKKYNAITCQVDRDLPELEEKIKELDKKKTLLTNELKPLIKLIDENKELPKNIENIKEEREKLRESHDNYQQNHKLMEKYDILKEEEKHLESKQNKEQKSAVEVKKLIEKLKEKYNDLEFREVEKKREYLLKMKSQIDTMIEGVEEQQNILKNELQTLKSYEKERDKWNIKKNKLNNTLEFCNNIRLWFKDAGTLMNEALLNQINQLASQLHRELVGNDSIDLEWLPDYDIKITTSQNEKNFAQLSGGEQMTAALAIRLAILKVLTNSDFAFFDEPTTNLDLEKRQNLAKCIYNIQTSKNFKQLFVISHDDTFEENADFVVRFSKDDNEKTEVEYLT
jgi:exonuclease SbcC